MQPSRHLHGIFFRFFNRKKPEEQEQKQKENENTEKKDETANAKKEGDKTAETKEKTADNTKEQKKTSKEDASSGRSDKDAKKETSQSTIQNLAKLLNEKPEGFENDIRQLFRKQEQELDVKTKTIDDLVQKVLIKYSIEQPNVSFS